MYLVVLEYKLRTKNVLQFQVVHKGDYLSKVHLSPLHTPLYHLHIHCQVEIECHKHQMKDRHQRVNPQVLVLGNHQRCH